MARDYSESNTFTHRFETKPLLTSPKCERNHSARRVASADRPSSANPSKTPRRSLRHGAGRRVLRRSADPSGGIRQSTRDLEPGAGDGTGAPTSHATSVGPPSHRSG